MSEDEGSKPLGAAAPPVPGAMMAQAMAVAEGNQEAGKLDTHAEESHPLSQGLTGAEVPSPDAPPTFGSNLARIASKDSNLGVETEAVLAPDGRININIHQSSRKLSAVLGPALQKQLQGLIKDQTPLPEPYIPPELGGDPNKLPPPRMAIVIHVVGSRGDVQPFVALGKVLRQTYNHRVRLATHLTFKDFVEDNGLEFFNIGGDPAALMAFMVKNPGLMPGFDTLRSGDVGKRRKEIATMIKGCWRSCIETGDGTGPEASDETFEEWMEWSRVHQAMYDPHPMDIRRAPFIADAIIANPPSFAHIHCAEKLGCPLHLMFTMPYSPTQAFPHPLANIQSSNADASVTNLMTYGMVDMLTWQGLGDVINRFRQHTLGLEPISLMWAPNMISRLRIPYTYCWSPALIPKPKDWGNNISISGFYFLKVASNYKPDAELQAFLDAGPPPVYIGFGSIVVDDPNAMTQMVFDAVKKIGQRALVSKGWGGIGGEELSLPEGVMLLGNVPHDWLFQHVSCVVHHGGAGTTAAGIAAGKPTVVVPFFGDQPFWGAMVARAGAGPFPIPYKALDADKLAKQINTALEPNSLERAKELAASIASENGCQAGATSFHQQVRMDDLRCTLAPHRKAVWRIKRTKIKLSAIAATVLGNEGYIDFKDLKLFRPCEYETDTGPTDPITGGGAAIVGTIGNIMMGLADFPAETLKSLHIHPHSGKKNATETPPTPATPNEPKVLTETVGSMKAGITSENCPFIYKNPGDANPGTSTPTTPLESPSAVASPRSSSQFNLNESLSKVRSKESGDSSSIASERPSSMRMALRDHLSDEFINTELGRVHKARSRSHQRNRSNSPARHVTPSHVDTIIDTSVGISRVVGAGLRAPMEFTHAVARGFHNAPKLYGDDTVRAPEHISDFKSGFRAAGKEFSYGLYDGITGMVTQPLSGAKKEGALGFFKGVGKGIGGLMLKPPAAVMGLAGYSMKGVFQELQGHYSNPVQNYMIAARTMHGMWAFHFSSAEERESVVERWIALQATLKKKKNPDEMLADWKSETAEKIKQHRELRCTKVKTFLHRTDFGTLLRRHTTRQASKVKTPDSEYKLSHASTSPYAGSTYTLDHPDYKPKDLSHPKHSSTFPANSSQSSLPTPDSESSYPLGFWSPAFGSSRATSAFAPHDDDELEAAIQSKIAQHATDDPAHNHLLEHTIRESVKHVDIGPHADERHLLHHDEHDDDSDEGSAIALAAKAAVVQARDLGAAEPVDDGGLADAIRESLREFEEQERARREEEEMLERVKGESLKAAEAG